MRRETSLESLCASAPLREHSPGCKVTHAEAQRRRDEAWFIVWDVDLLRDKVIRVYRVSAPVQPVIYHIGDTAEAEPALPGWTLPVADLLR